MSAYTDGVTAVRAARKASNAARDELYAVELKALAEDRKRAGEVGGGTPEVNADVEAARKTVRKNDAELRATIGKLYGRLGPQQLIEAWDDSLPIMLLPLRLEARWRTEAPASELLVRVYPDDVAVTTHERILTPTEVENGRAYWIAFQKAAGEVTAQGAAWTALAGRFGANRAAWVAHETQPLNWASAATDPSIELVFPDVPLTKPDAWTIAPHSRVLPDRYVLMAWRGDVLRITQLGELIDDVVVVGPSPLEDAEGDATIARDETNQTLAFGDSFVWVRDFDTAVKKGMGFRVAVSADDITNGFDRMLVLGVKLSADAPDAQALLEALIDDHHYSAPGFELLRQGTPTNNTDASDSGYSSSDRGAESTVAESSPPLFVPTADRASATDGQRFADFLGLSYAPLLYAQGADHADHAEAIAMNRALYAGTLGYYVDHMLNEVVDDAWLGTLRRHFTDQVTGRGPIAAIRVGSQPYGVLPTSSLARWQPPSGKTTNDPFEAPLLRVLRRFDSAWSTVVPQLVQVGSPGDGTAHLLDVLGLQPTSAEFYQRVGYSYDYLKNLEGFAWGGVSFTDVIKMLIEGASVRDMLQQLGYSPNRANGTAKALPLLIQLIWRHYHTKLDAAQLIDGRPLSESSFIKPYDTTTGATYLDWLLANAADGNALEAQNFGEAQSPGSLLYLMLHFSLVMEASRGIHRWLATHAINGDELVRSRKFLNVGATASPSIWEVFRAPANAIVTGEPSELPLLEVIHSPAVAADAGQSVQEQRSAIDALRAMPTARLERALVEHIDTLSYRLDAWTTSLFSRRLHRQRNMDEEPSKRRTGVYLGAYGYLEQVKAAGANRQRIPDATLPKALQQGVENLYTERTNGGYVHTPSLNHATAAALLRSGYLTHATPSDPNALAVNLSSARVERTKALLDGVRNGQSLEVLLGIQFERGLHDWTTRPVEPVILDQLKPLFRTHFPILRTRVPQTTDASSGGGATVITEDYQVVNGLTLARTMTPFPYGIAELSALSSAQQSAIQTEKAAIENTLDALRDVLTTESAYQLALGNFDRAAAVMQSVGNGTVPPDVDAIATPRGTGVAFTQRLAVHFDSSVTANPWPAVPLSERARLEPALNAWIGDLLGAPQRILCRASALDASGNVLVVGGVPVEGIVSVADLGLQPIDFMYVVRSQVEESGAAELEARVRYVFARARGVPDDVVVHIAFADAGGDTDARSFAEALPLADRLRRLVGSARPLDGRHYQSTSKDAPAPAGNPGRVDAAELRTRVGARIGTVRALFPALQAALSAAAASRTPATVDTLRAALVAVANAGVTYAFPRSSVGATAVQLDALSQQATMTLSRAAALGVATDDQLADVDAAPLAEEKVALLTDAAKAWMGADMVVLPRFVFPDAAGAAQAHAGRDALLAHVHDTIGIPLPVDEWLHGAACVRPRVHDFEIVRMMADAVRDDPLTLAPLQLPFHAGDTWLGAQYPATMNVMHDTVSVVQHLPQGFNAAGAQCGLLIDEWLESIPNREEVTGLAFNFNAPNSAPPQALLLAVTPNETGSWQWDDLVDSVLDTFRRARLRAVEPDALGDLPAIGTLLPAVVAEFGTGRGSVSLDYSFVLDAIRLPVTAMTAATVKRG